MTASNSSPGVASDKTEEDPTAPVLQVTLMAQGFMHSQALYVIAKLGIASRLANGSCSVTDLAEATQTHEDSLRRLLRTMASFGLFHEESQDVYALTPLGAVLDPNTPGSPADLVISWMETHYLPFSKFIDTIRTGVPSAQMYYGKPFFDWLAENPEQAEGFTRAMRAFTDGALAPLLQDYHLPAGKTVADIGGADGTLLCELIAKEPERSGIIFDLPRVAASAHRALAENGLSDRVEVQAGDFFKSVPEANVYVLKYILHDWNDANCVSILQNIAAAAPPNARLVIFEAVIPPGDEPNLSKAADLTMLGSNEGKERTAAEFETLLRSAGFEVERMQPTPGLFSIIEARKA